MEILHNNRLAIIVGVLIVDSVVIITDVAIRLVESFFLIADAYVVVSISVVGDFFRQVNGHTLFNFMGTTVITTFCSARHLLCPNY